jgi:DNA-binding PadR family transcriptional regulator
VSRDGLTVAQRRHLTEMASTENGLYWYPVGPERRCASLLERKGLVACISYGRGGTAYELTPKGRATVEASE